ncbi:DUF3426 domain-containing protein [Uliginosibacterium sp. H1]|uniref:DUF3426 domain-containing protein n=1 Tax=Uliginosibacterium sp. H1 TaxID=3114757 RepID=UPI002E17DDF3|nr:DUF3426 domain-containing protein [Uliginosibacterium sp. H1]
MLVTRCPNCSTAFRIRPEQLGLRGGRVRCGNCQNAFSALNSLEEMPDDTDLVQTTPAAAPTPATPPPAATPQPAAPAPAPQPIAPSPPPRPAPPPPATPPAPVASRPAATTPPPTPSLPPMPQHAAHDDHSIQPFAPPRADNATPVMFDYERTDLNKAFEPTLLMSPEANPSRDFALPDNVDFDLSDDIRIEPGAPDDWEIPHFEGVDVAPPAKPQPVAARKAGAAEQPVDESSETEPPNDVVHIDEHFDLGPLDEPEPETQLLRKEAGMPDTQVGTLSLAEERAASHLPLPQDSGKRKPWALGILVLGLLVLLQATYMFRTEIARAQPDLRPLLEDLCGAVGCSVPYPHDSDAIAVEATDLNPEPGNPGHYRLVVTLRNKADYAQQWPHIELTLTDRFDRALARKVFAPREWLPAQQKGQAAFEAGGEITADVPLAARELPASGFRVYVFHP